MSSSRQECPRCGSEEVSVREDWREVTARDGTVLRFPDEWTRCERCGEEFYAREQSLASSRASAGAVRAYEGFLGPEEIRQLRERYGLSQEAFEKALGVGRKTVVRWEKGSVCQSRAMDTLLRLADRHPGVFAEIARQNGVELWVAGSAGAARAVFSTSESSSAQGTVLVSTTTVAPAIAESLESPAIEFSTELDDGVTSLVIPNDQVARAA